MELLQGATFESILARGGPLPARDVAAIVASEEPALASA